MSVEVQKDPGFLPGLSLARYFATAGRTRRKRLIVLFDGFSSS